MHDVIFIRSIIQIMTSLKIGIGFKCCGKNWLSVKTDSGTIGQSLFAFKRQNQVTVFVVSDKALMLCKLVFLIVCDYISVFKDFTLYCCIVTYV